MNIKQVIIDHYNMYKSMEIIDIIKLIYQNEFGGGHLISDQNKCLNYIINEYNLSKKEKNIPLYVDVGNGLIRLNLNSSESDKIDLYKLNEIFILSSEKVKGSLSSFKEKLQLVKELIVDKSLDFSFDEYMAFIDKYEAANYPMVSHSKKYKEYYYPAYRIILKEYLKECLKTSV